MTIYIYFCEYHIYYIDINREMITECDTLITELVTQNNKASKQC